MKKLRNALLAPFIRLLRRWTGSLNPYVPEDLARDGIEPVRIEESQVKRQAGKLVLLVFLVFVVWSVTAPIDQGVVVSGTVVVMGSRKAVQHPSGGVVEELRVKEGDQVRQGDVLLTLNPLSTQANLLQAENDFINALASYSRLIAERIDATSITWDPELEALGTGEQARQSRKLQQALFVSRRSEYLGQREILSRQGEGLKQQLIEKERILAMRREQLAPLEEDARSMRRLATDGFVPRTSANNAERSSTDALIGITTLQSDISNTRVAITANELELSKLRAAYHKQVDAELTEAQKSKEALRARVQSLQFEKNLTTIKAPSSGVIVGIKTHTVGGVISGGQVLMEVVPSEQTLVIDAAVPPQMIDKVSVGMQADLRFTAFNSITTPVVPGTVRLVGADRLPPQPPMYPQEYFLAQIVPTAEGYRTLGDKEIVAGMPVEVVIKSGERTFMSYLFKPLLDRFARSFKE